MTKQYSNAFNFSNEPAFAVSCELAFSPLALRPEENHSQKS